MQIFAKSIDDFKTERKDVSPPLPAYLRLVPLFFYLSVVASILLNALFLANFSQAVQARDRAKSEDKQLQADIGEVKGKRQALEAETKKASDLAAWVDSSRALQPLVVEIARSMEKDAALLELSLQRDMQNPTQIQLGLRLQSSNPRQLDLALQTIANSRFRTFSPQQNTTKGEVDYKATLMWQGANREPSSSTQ